MSMSNQAEFPSRSFAFPVLTGDIGGTNARFGLVEAPGAEPVFLQRLAVADHPTPETAIDAVIKAFDIRPASAFLAVAGPVEGLSVAMTNAHWLVDAAMIGKRFGLHSVSLINDFPPIAAALSSLTEGNGAVRIGPDCPPQKGACLAIGPGTGCGAAALVPAEDKLVLLPTEVGHTNLGPDGPEELALWPHIDSRGHPISVETLLCGPGLVTLHSAVLRHKGLPVEPCQPHEIIDYAQSGEQFAMRTLYLFARLLGRVAGDLALLFRATGGVYIAGGIAPRIVNILVGSEFREAFDNKPPLTDSMKTIPTLVITDPNPALRGLAAIVSAPHKHIIPAWHWDMSA